MKKTYTVTLNRAHKIAERLGSKQGELRALVKSLSELVSLNGYSEQQVARLSEMKTQVIGKVKEHADAANAQAVIRGAIGRANADHGVNEVLSQIEANKKIILCLNDVITTQGESTRGGIVKLSELGDYKPLTQGEGLLRGASINISIMDDCQIRVLTVEKEYLEKSNFSLTDKLADLNGKLVKFEMEEDIAELMGLS